MCVCVSAYVCMCVRWLPPPNLGCPLFNTPILEPREVHPLMGGPNPPTPPTPECDETRWASSDSELWDPHRLTACALYHSQIRDATQQPTHSHNTSRWNKSPDMDNCKDAFVKICTTPGCTFADFHFGPHSNDPSSSVPTKRSRKTVEDNRRATDCRGLSSYSGPRKVGHRAQFVSVAQTCGSLVVYLDGADGALTNLLLESGIEPERLVPVNNKKAVATQIELDFPKVTCKVDDILRIAADAEVHEFGAIWFDMCSMDFGSYDVSDLLHCSENKFFTLSSRMFLPTDLLRGLCTSLVAGGEKILEQSVYTGVSGRAMNMIFVASKGKCAHKKPRLSETESDEDSTTNGEITTSTVVKIPLSYWSNTSFVEEFKYKTFDDCLIGSVSQPVSNSRSQFRIKFQLVTGDCRLCMDKYSSSTIRRFAM